MDAEPSFIARLWEFLWAVISAWSVVVTGGVLVIEQFLELVLPKKLWEKVDAKIPKVERRRLLLWLCAFAFIYASFSAYDDVNKRLRLIQENNQSAQNRNDFPAAPSQQADFYSISGYARPLSQNQTKIISSLGAKDVSEIGRLTIFYYSTAKNINYIISFVEAFKLSGIEVVDAGSASPDGPDQTGVMLSCAGPGNLTDPALRVRKILQAAHIDARAVPMLRSLKKYNMAGCVIFIGPSDL
jgi:hypothetical protein